MIRILSSVRQGDPIAMLLYIIYLEPFLKRLREQTSGLSFPSFSQIDEDFCDDVNILIQNEEDFAIVDKLVSRFESVSGAILNRNRKSKVMGLGRLTGRENWPLNWL